jgi:hypothetical protein
MVLIMLFIVHFRFRHHLSAMVMVGGGSFGWQKMAGREDIL